MQFMLSPNLSISSVIEGSPCRMKVGGGLYLYVPTYPARWVQITISQIQSLLVKLLFSRSPGFFSIKTLAGTFMESYMAIEINQYSSGLNMLLHCTAIHARRYDHLENWILKQPFIIKTFQSNEKLVICTFETSLCMVCAHRYLYFK